MLQVRPAQFLKLSWSSALSGFNLSFVAFFLLLVPESLVFTLRNGGLEALSLIHQAALLGLFAFFYAILFNLVFLLLRLIAAGLSHADWLLTRVTPGLVVFTALGGPLTEMARLPLPGLEGIETALRVALFFGMSLGVGAFLVYASPIFRGYNPVFLLASALIARFLLAGHAGFPSGEAADLSSAQVWLDFLIYELNLFLAIFFLFIAFQIRYRLHLAPNYESIRVPRSLLYWGAALSFVAMLLLVSTAAPVDQWNVGGSTADSLAIEPPFAPVGDGDRQEIPAALLFLCLLQWTLTAFALRSRENSRIPQQLQLARWTMVRTVVLLFTFLLSFLLAAANPFASQSLGRIATAGGLAWETVSFLGILMDRDGDGNSAWPGEDPDDSDACVRFDFHAPCAASDAPPPGDLSARAADPRQLEQGLQNARTPGGSGPVRAAELRHGVRLDAPDRELPELDGPPQGSLTLLTIVGTSAPPRPLRLRKNDEGEWYPLGSEHPAGDRSVNETLAPLRARLLFATDRAEHSLRAMHQDLNGIEEMRDVHRKSVLAEFTELGYRTICSGSDNNLEYLGADSPLRLDAGCQILDPKESGEPESLADATTRGLEQLDAYRERANLLWIHFRGAEAVEDLELGRAFARLADRGPVAVIFFPRANSLRGNAWLYPERSRRTRYQATQLDDYPNFRELAFFAAGLRSRQPSTQVERIGALYDQPFASSWVGRLTRNATPGYPLYPVYTFQLSEDRVLIFDAISGARWREAPAHQLVAPELD